MVDKVGSPLKWHGGKGYLAAKIVAMMPPHVHYVEPYAGSLAVLFAKDPEGVSEVVNDLNSDLTRFWQILQCPSHFEEFRRRVETTPFSEWEWEEARKQRRTRGEDEWPDPVERAALWFIHCRQSLAGRMDSFAPLSRTRTRRGMNEQASAWLSAVEGLPAVHERLKRVVILNRDALDVISQQDGPDTLFYLDPPYLDETRTSPEVYSHEMTKFQHIDLLALLSGVEGRFLLSGYRSKLYDGYAHAEGWVRRDFDLPNNAAGGETKRRMTECVWANYQLPEAT